MIPPEPGEWVRCKVIQTTNKGGEAVRWDRLPVIASRAKSFTVEFDGENVEVAHSTWGSTWQREH